ncbi:MAG TPA: hypothetical protein H9912_08610 [Candidatus Eisenbergiella stercorigallinarum]|uniref:Uncharacterized protein n=1 Tax=Candidatus Eisenbergiella stercorigallinarum TaxID=2838557 RepID=A0A9D2R189_9FIRM|nr:hypothetical protein [Candidatus Eisenbergiella stercorigallinarum]
MADISENKEIREAIQAGEAALFSLKNAREKLDSAKNWGIFDIVGGGFVSSLIKHSRMDDAQEYMEEAKQNLRRFEKELQDVSLSDSFARSSSIDISSFVRFADSFFDNMILDFYVQSQIRQTLDAVENAIRQVEDILTALRKGGSYGMSR